MATPLFGTQAAKTRSALSSDNIQKFGQSGLGFNELNAELEKNQAANLVGAYKAGEDIAESAENIRQKKLINAETEYLGKSRREAALNKNFADATGDYNRLLENEGETRSSSGTGIAKGQAKQNKAKTDAATSGIVKAGAEAAAEDPNAAPAVKDAVMAELIKPKTEQRKTEGEIAALGASTDYTKAQAEALNSDLTAAKNGRMSLSEFRSKHNNPNESFALSMATNRDTGAVDWDAVPSHLEAIIGTQAGYANQSQMASHAENFRTQSDRAAKDGEVKRAAAEEIQKISKQLKEWADSGKEPPSTEVRNLLAGSKNTQTLLQSPAASGLFGTAGAALTDFAGITQKLTVDRDKLNLLKGAADSVAAPLLVEAKKDDDLSLGQFAGSVAFNGARNAKSASRAASGALQAVRTDRFLSDLNAAGNRVALGYVLNSEDHSDPQVVAASVMRADPLYANAASNQDAISLVAEKLKTMKNAAGAEYARAPQIIRRQTQ